MGKDEELGDEIEEGQVEERSWSEFRKTGLIWWVNRVLHLWGWVIVCELDEEGEITRVFPARCGFRGFTREVEEDGFLKLTRYTDQEIGSLGRFARRTLKEKRDA